MNTHKAAILRHLPIYLLVLVNVVIGVLIVRDYGESWDEPAIYVYAGKNLQAYPGVFATGVIPDVEYTNLANYGPANFMADALLAQAVHSLFPVWSLIDGWHLGYFLAFQIGVLSIYFLTKRWMSTWSAFGTAVIFSTQPLLWGHAFINPKDIPFMGFFLASVALGFSMVDALPSPPPGGSVPYPIRQLKKEWRDSRSPLKRIVWTIFILYLLPVQLMLTGFLNGLIAIGIPYLYHLGRKTRLGAWFARHAANAYRLPVSNYIHKAQVLLFRAEMDYLLAGFAVVILVFLAFFPWVFPRDFARWVRESLLPFFKRTVRLFSSPLVLSSGVLLGITTSIRVVGPYAGILVLLYALYKSWRKAFLLFIPYTFVSLLTSFITWPYLWGDPVNRFIQSVTLITNFNFHMAILFRGSLIAPNNLPNYFLPFMMSIQLTEPTLLLFVFGLGVSVWMLIKDRRLEPFTMLIVWSVIPILVVIRNRSVIYDNFRQLLFVLPPYFVIGGVGLEAIFRKVRPNALKALILCLLVIPGVVPDIALHPYQYVYYNSLVGGVRGASNQYEMDYWITSYRAAAEYLNEVAPQNARIIVLQTADLFQSFARPDLVIIPSQDIPKDLSYNFIVADTRFAADQSYCQSAPIVKTIGRAGAVFSIIRKAPASIQDCH